MLLIPSEMYLLGKTLMCVGLIFHAVLRNTREQIGSRGLVCLGFVGGYLLQWVLVLVEEGGGRVSHMF